MKNKFNEKWTMRIISLVLASLIFLFVNYESTRTVNSYRPGSGASITTEEVVENVPIEVTLDTNEYYISGVPEFARVTLSGPHSVITQFLATQNLLAQTQDLNELGVGTHNVSLHIKDLPNRINAEIEPENFEVTIEKRVTMDYNVEVLYDDEIFSEEVEVGQPQLSQNRVTVSGRESEINQIERVAVVIPPGQEPYRENVTGNYPVIAQDANNQLVDVNIEPAEIYVSIPIDYPEKTVPIRLEMENESDDYNYDVRIASDQMNQVTLKGPREVLDKIQSIPVRVNLQGITNSTTRTIDLQKPDGVREMSLTTVTVVIDARSKNVNNGQESLEESEASPTEEEASISTPSNSSREESGSSDQASGSDDARN